MGEYFFNLILFFVRSVERKVRRRIVVRRVALQHFSNMVWTFQRVILPIILCYLMVGLFIQEPIFGPLVLGLILFVYGNFFPDFDSLFRRRKGQNTKKLNWFKRILLLCFAPIFILMFYKGAWKIPSSETSRIFHNFKSVTMYGLFLFSLGYLIYNSLIEASTPLIFGLSGYLAHLKVDKYW